MVFIFKTLNTTQKNKATDKIRQNVADMFTKGLVINYYAPVLYIYYII